MTQPPAGTPLLTLRGVCKRFGAVAALVDVDLDVRPGEVHAVLGENGAGKSTLMKAIYGLVAIDAGTLRLAGRPVRFRSAIDARRAGIGMVHQEFALADALTVAENLALSLSPPGQVRWAPDRVAAAARRIAADAGLDLGDLSARAGTLPVGLRQRIEIVKALAGDTRILILDEPTAVLAPAEVEQLFAVLDRLRRGGTAVLFITHRLSEVMAVADRVTVMRRGRVVAQAERRDVTETELAHLMVGPLALDTAPSRPAPAAADLALELASVSVTTGSGVPALDGVTLAVRRGEILGIAGVDGNGQAELFEVVTGLRRPAAGALRVGGREVRHFDPAALIASGVACIPPDRQRFGVVADMSVQENAVLNAALLRRAARGAFLRPSAQHDVARDLVERYAIRTDGLDGPVGRLSGGNLQRLIVARALALAPRVLVAANPTRGLDVAASQAVYAAFDAACDAGTAVLLISTDLDEILTRCDRTAVLFRGRLSPVFDRPFPVDRIGPMLAGRPETP